MILWCRCVHECSLIFDLRTPATSTNRLHSATSGTRTLQSPTSGDDTATSSEETEMRLQDLELAVKTAFLLEGAKYSSILHC
ncbi:uncharacterized protein LOC143033006 [Oratosquilla oratoria]|uniref:uncharacterized protein LOC143033006 n=1 Tax=Oratosquilla oratoria TaxID=337810 RepID=UPI003F7713FC